jgi:hypothetical protein
MFNRFEAMPTQSVASQSREYENERMRLSVAAIFLFPPLAFTQRSFQPKPIAPKEFAVMAWGDSPSDTEQLRGMKDAGLNISGFCRAKISIASKQLV